MRFPPPLIGGVSFVHFRQSFQNRFAKVKFVRDVRRLEDQNVPIETIKTVRILRTKGERIKKNIELSPAWGGCTSNFMFFVIEKEWKLENWE